MTADAWNGTQWIKASTNEQGSEAEGPITDYEVEVMFNIKALAADVNARLVAGKPCKAQQYLARMGVFKSHKLKIKRKIRHILVAQHHQHAAAVELIDRQTSPSPCDISCTVH